MNAQNSTETIVIPKFTNNPIDTVIKIRQVRARMIVCPAMILANRRIIKANGLVNTPKNSTKGMIGNGSFREIGALGQKTAVTAMLPVMLAPPGKTGMIPIRLLIRIKKKTVSR